MKLVVLKDKATGAWSIQLTSIWCQS